MGDIRATQEAIEVLASEPDAEPRVTQGAVQVLASESAADVQVTQEAIQVLASEPPGDAQVTQEVLVILANPPGTITSTQEVINVLGEEPTDAQVTQAVVQVLAGVTTAVYTTQTAIAVLADYVTNIVTEDPNDGGGGSGDGTDEDDTGGEGHTTPPPYTSGLTSTLTTIKTLSFVPTDKTKFLILAQCFSGTTYSTTTDPVQTVLGQSVLLVNGVTVAETDIGSMSTFYCYTGEIGITTTVEIKAKNLQLDANEKAYAARISAIGLNDWYRIEQGIDTTLAGSTTQGKTILMEDILEPTFGKSLVFSYVEYNPDETNDTTRGTYSVSLDNPAIKNATLIDMVISKRSYYKEDFGLPDQLIDNWSSFSYYGFLDFTGSRTLVKHITSKLDASSNAIKFRRLRTVIIPIVNNPFGTITEYGDFGGTQLTGTSTESLTMTPPPRTVTDFDYLVLAHAKTHVDQGNGPHQLAFRYGGLGLAGTTSNLVGITGLFSGAATTTTLAGITFGIQDSDILAIKTYNYAEDSVIYPGFNGEQQFGFAYVGATQTAVNGYWFFSANQYQYDIENRFRTGDRRLALIQFKNEAATLTEDLKNSTNNAYNKRTLVEINLVDSILRYCLQEDTYLLDNFSNSQILSLIGNGTIDAESAEDILVTGSEVLSALEVGLTSTALDYLTLNTTVIDGITTSTGSEYTSQSAIRKLYKKGVISDIGVKDKLPDSLYGVVEVDSIELELYDTDGSLLTQLDNLQGATVKVRSYDVDTGELRTIGHGSITSLGVSAGKTLIVKCNNPDTRVLDAKYPFIKVSDLVRTTTVVGETTRLADDNNALVPVFFGNARRLVANNIHKYYGTTTTSPAEYLDAYSDYVIGGPLSDNIGIGDNGYFNYVLMNQAYVTTGMYREWVGITNSIEFNSSTIYEYDKYTYKDTNIPTFRFAAYQITEPTRSSPLGLPHGATSAGNYDDIETYYPSLTPVTSVLHVYNFVKGLDWTYDNTGSNSNKIGWGFSGVANQPEYSGLSTSVLTITRGTERGGKDYLLTNNGTTTSVFANIYNVVSVSQRIYLPGSTTIYDDLTYNTSKYDLHSSNELRAFEDIIDWSPTRGYKGYWAFDGTLDSGVTSSYALIGTDGQPYYTDDCLEFINSETLGTCYIPGISSSNLSMKIRWMLYAEVSTNLDGDIVGHIVAKNNFDSASLADWEGYQLMVDSQAMYYGDGVTTRFIPCFQAAYGTGVTLFTEIIGATSSTYNLADGNVHSILIVNSELSGGYGATYLYVDNVLDGYDSANYYDSNVADTTNDFIVGGNESGATFEGRINVLYIDNGSHDEPLPGTTYSVTVQHKPDTYTAEWEYLVYSASNPIQTVSNDQAYVIAGDFKVNGCDIEPSIVYAGITGSNNASTWLQYSYPHGYAVQLNRQDYVGTDGYMEIYTENISDVSFTRDFCVYIACKHSGDELTQDLLVKPTLGQPSYLLGITNGYAYAKITGRGDTITLVSDVFICDDQAHFLMLERDGFTMNLYVDERKVATTRVKRGRTTDYLDSQNIYIGTNGDTGNNWTGDILFVGACNYAPGNSFAAYQTNLLAKGVKGAWVRRTSDSSYKTIFHIPFIEGTGLEAYSRNLARNPAYNIKRLLTDPVFGMNEPINSTSFDDAAVILDDEDLVMDFVTRGERTFADVLRDMCILRGMQLKKDPLGRWKLKIDSVEQKIRGRFGLNDGYYNNIVELKSYEIADVESQVKNVTLRYRYMPDIVGELNYLVSVSRDVSQHGVQTLVIDSPYIIDHSTADKCIDYLSKRLKYSTKKLNIAVGQEARNLEIGDIILVNIPSLALEGASFKIIEMGYNISTLDLVLEEYSTEVFNYTPGTYPVDENIPTGDDRVGLI